MNWRLFEFWGLLTLTTLLFFMFVYFTASWFNWADQNDRPWQKVLCAAVFFATLSALCVFAILPFLLSTQKSLP